MLGLGLVRVGSIAKLYSNLQTSPKPNPNCIYDFNLNLVLKTDLNPVLSHFV